ncbi:MAG: hypothetical protein KAU20_01080 [Nanoarchaeota archaeon]|nr:hypothetical protein [Nanoarchaeota archaeon]
MNNKKTYLEDSYKDAMSFERIKDLKDYRVENRDLCMLLLNRKKKKKKRRF